MVITSEEMQIIDRNCEEMGISTLQLIENAGAAATNLALKSFSNIKKVVVCCGTGKNGGVGMVVARHLATNQKKVKVVVIRDENQIQSAITLRNYRILKEMECSIDIIEVSKLSTLKDLKPLLTDSDLIVDAILGLGLSVTPSEPTNSTIQAINRTNKKVLSLDLPSGMFAGRKKKPTVMIKADLIATFHDTKPCLTMNGLKEKTVVCSIGVPPEAEIFVGRGDLEVFFPKHDAFSQNGEKRMVLVVGGSEKNSKAPVLSAQAAIQSGTDLVVMCIPQSIENMVKSASPNMIFQPFKGDYLTAKHVKEIANLTKKFDSVIFGSGLNDHPASIKFVEQFLPKISPDKSIIIDGDALPAIKNHLNVLQGKQVILTPNIQEFRRFFNSDDLPDEILERHHYVYQRARKISTTILLKGKYDYISNGQMTKVNRAGHIGMAVEGTGDVLAGILGAISVTVQNTFRAACAGAYLAGKAGEIAAKDFGTSLLPTDVIARIPDVILAKADKNMVQKSWMEDYFHQ